MTGSRATALDHVFALRPLLWIPAIALFEVGRATFDRRWPPPSAWFLLLALLAVLSAVHLANAWRDRAGDRLNRKGGAMAAGRLGGRRMTLMVVALLVGAAAASWRATLGPSEGAFLSFAVVLGIAYTMPPVEAKRRVGFDLLAQALGYGVVAFGLGASAAGADFLHALRASVPYALGIATVGVLTMLADRAGDEAVGQRTTAVVLGEARAASLALVLAFITLAAGLALGAWPPALWGLLATAYLGLAASQDWNRAAVTLQIVFLLLLTPFTLIPLAVSTLLAAAAAAYDQRRGGAGYPLRSAR